MAERHRTTPDQQQAGVSKVISSGGLQISMDLSSAFDLVPWSSVKDALELAQVDSSIQENPSPMAQSGPLHLQAQKS